jgi:tRNA threonylcarbamoyladenosine modification (KEOPS) complex  Pcc1 subunit
MECSGSLEFVFPSSKEAENALSALGHEDSAKRARALVCVRGKTLCVEINAEDSVALRAHMNSYLRQLKVIEATIGV